MESLKKSMKWDEQVYGLAYDLDIFMIVAVSHFNMGAMENKGLNIFNSKFILADEQTASDDDLNVSKGSLPTNISITGQATASPAVTGSADPERRPDGLSRSGIYRRHAFPRGQACR